MSVSYALANMLENDKENKYKMKPMLLLPVGRVISVPLIFLR